jgi:hypothetical protein
MSSSGSYPGDSRRATQWLLCHESEIVPWTTPPYETWSWPETDLSHKVLYRLKEVGLITQTESGEWRTERSLWEWVVEQRDEREDLPDDRNQDKNEKTEDRDVSQTALPGPDRRTRRESRESNAEDAGSPGTNPGGSTMQTALLKHDDESGGDR